MKRNFLILSTVIIILTIIFTVGCKPDGTMINEEKTKAESLSVDVNNVIMATGESFVLGYTIKPSNAEESVTFSSSDPQTASINSEGKITALKAGKAKITAKLNDEIKADCEVTIADVIVDSTLNANGASEDGTQGGSNEGSAAQQNDEIEGQNDSNNDGGSATDNGQNAENNAGNEEGGENSQLPETGEAGEEGAPDQNVGNDSHSTSEPTNGESAGNAAQSGNANGGTPVINVGGKEGETLFATITQGVAKAKDGDVILIKSGNYAETVSVNKKLSIMGMGEVIVKKIRVERGAELTAENLTITDVDYPVGNDARVYVAQEGVLNMKNCVLETVSEDELTGGYAIYAEKQCKGLTVEKNTISNFRYGIYVSPTDQTIKIVENTFSNMNVGVGLDIRQENSQLNYPTKGEIKDNQFNEVQDKAQFFHYGEEYDGEFSFDDLEEESEEQTQTQPQGMAE